MKDLLFVQQPPDCASPLSRHAYKLLSILAMVFNECWKITSNDAYSPETREVVMGIAELIYKALKEKE